MTKTQQIIYRSSTSPQDLLITSSSRVAIPCTALSWIQVQEMRDAIADYFIQFGGAPEGPPPRANMKMRRVFMTRDGEQELAHTDGQDVKVTAYTIDPPHLWELAGVLDFLLDNMAPEPNVVRLPWPGRKSEPGEEAMASL